MPGGYFPVIVNYNVTMYFAFIRGIIPSSLSLTGGLHP